MAYIPMPENTGFQMQRTMPTALGAPEQNPGASEGQPQFRNGNPYFNAQGMARKPYRDMFQPGSTATIPEGMKQMMSQMQQARNFKLDPSMFPNGNAVVNRYGMLRKPFRNMMGQMQGGSGPAMGDMAGRMRERQSDLPAGYASPQPPAPQQSFDRQDPATGMMQDNWMWRDPSYPRNFGAMQGQFQGQNPYAAMGQQFGQPMQSFMGGNPFASMGMPGGWQGAQPFYPMAQSMPGIGSMFGGY